MSERILESIELCVGKAAIGTKISDTINKVNDAELGNTEPVLSDEIKVSRMGIHPFKITAIMSLQKPVITSCLRPLKNRFTLTCAPFNNAGFPHTSSVWQISTDNFLTVLKEVDSSVELVSVVMDLVKILSAQNYYFKVKHRSTNLESPWSDILTIKTAAPLPISTPTVELVEQYDTEDPELFRATSSTYTHEELLHTKSVWQISKQSNFGVVLSEFEDTVAPLTTINTSITDVESLTDYFFRVKHFSDTFKSEWSLPYLINSRLLAGIEKPILSAINPICPFNFTLQGTAYVSSNPALLHTNTTWEINTTADFTTPLLSFTTPDGSLDLTTLSVAEDICQDQTTYYARAQYISGTIKSEWSDTLTCELMMTFNGYPKKIDYTPAKLEVTTEQGCRLEGCGNKLIGIYERQDNLCEVVEFLRDTEGTFIPITTIALDSLNFITKGHGNKLFYLHEQVSGTDTFYVLKELDLTTKVTRTISSSLKSNYQINLASSSIVCDGTSIWLNGATIYGDPVPHTLIRIPLNGQTWEKITTTGDPMIDYPLASNMTISVIKDGFMYLHSGIYDSYMWKFNLTTRVWLSCLKIPMVDGDWVFDLYDYNGKVLAIVVTTINDIECYQYLLYSDINNEWTTLMNVPGLLDYPVPWFGVMGDELYVTSIQLGRTIEPTLSGVTPYYKAIGSLAGNRGASAPSHTFVHNGKFGIYEQETYDGGYFNHYVSLTDVFTGNTTKERIDFGFDLFSPIVCYGEGKLFFCCGIINEVYSPTLYSYDLETKEILLLSSNGVASERFSMIYREGKIYCHGGYGSTWDNARIFDLTSQTWTNDLLLSLKKTDSKMVNIPTGILIYGGTNPSFPENDNKIFLWNLADNSLIDMGINTQDTNQYIAYNLFWFDGNLYSIYRYLHAKGGFEIYKHNGSEFQPFITMPFYYEASPTFWLNGDNSFNTNYSISFKEMVTVGGECYLLLDNDYSDLYSLRGPIVGGNAIVKFDFTNWASLLGGYTLRNSNHYTYHLTVDLNPVTFTNTVIGEVMVKLQYSYPLDGSTSTTTIDWDSLVPLKYMVTPQGSAAIIVNTDQFENPLLTMGINQQFTLQCKLKSVNNQESDWSNSISYNPI